jgi:hypothetical protein
MPFWLHDGGIHIEKGSAKLGDGDARCDWRKFLVRMSPPLSSRCVNQYAAAAARVRSNGPKCASVPVHARLMAI